MGIKELEAWVSAKKQKEETVRDGKRNIILLAEQKVLERRARAERDAHFLNQPEVRGAFEACAQELGRKWNDVVFRVVKPKDDKSKPRLELTWNYQFHREGPLSLNSSWSCDFISAEVDERNPETQRVVGIGFFQDNLSRDPLSVCVPVREVIIEKLIGIIKDPNRREQPSVRHPSFFKRVGVFLS